MTASDGPPNSPGRSDSTGSDRRRSARLPIRTTPAVACLLEEGFGSAPLPATIENVSTGGLLVHLRNGTADPPLRVGDRLGLGQEAPRHEPVSEESLLPVDVVRVQPVKRGSRAYWAVGCLFPAMEERASAEQLRLEGVLLMARTAEHLLNNQLSLTVGYTELLARDPRLPEDARALASEALHGATEAARTVQQFPRIRSVQVDEGPEWVEGRILDLPRAVQETTRQY